MVADQLIEQRVDTAMLALYNPDRVLREMLRTIYAYQESRDPAGLVTFAEDMLATVKLHLIPGYDKVLAKAPMRPQGRGRSIEEILAAHGM
jgi:hypothetical protein